MYLPRLVPIKPYPWAKAFGPPQDKYTSVIVCGTRTFDDWDLLKRKMDRITYWIEPVRLLVGGFGQRYERGGDWHYRGADFWAHQWAMQNWIPTRSFWAHWKSKGGAAGPLRNVDMAKEASQEGGYCVAFWDDRSPGTGHMIDAFLRYNSESNLQVVRY